MTDGSFSSMRVLLDGTALDTVTCAGAHDQDRIARSAGTKASASALRRDLVFGLMAVHPPSTQGWTDPWARVHRVDSLIARRKKPEMNCVTRCRSHCPPCRPAACLDGVGLAEDDGHVRGLALPPRQDAGDDREECATRLIRIIPVWMLSMRMGDSLLC